MSNKVEKWSLLRRCNQVAACCDGALWGTLRSLARGEKFNPSHYLASSIESWLNVRVLMAQKSGYLPKLRRPPNGAILRAALGLLVALFSGVVASAEPRPVSFEVARPGYDWSFPRDHGKHSEYESEWWYYTGQLYPHGSTPFKDPPQFGFQLTFFRRSVVVAGQRSEEFLAHSALTDIRRGVTLFNEREGGGQIGVAGVADGALRAWSGDWRAEMFADRHVLLFSNRDAMGPQQSLVRLVSEVAAIPWLQGAGGFSKKAECEGCASLYYSFPALTVRGDVLTQQGPQAVEGLAWMDHEIMTNALAPGQVGWDWMGLMFEDGTRLMLFSVRGDAKSTSYVSGTVLREGGSLKLEGGDIALTPLEFWGSAKTSAKYPIRWRVQVKSQGIDIEVAARVNASELGSRDRVYWEGPVASSDEGVIGYLEMTGYAGKIDL